MQDLSLYFEALADKKRLDILRYLSESGDTTVTNLGRAVRISQPLMSWHLRLLRRSGIVKTHRDGRHVRCSLDRETIRRYERKLHKLLDIHDTPGQEESLEHSSLLAPAHTGR